MAAPLGARSERLTRVASLRTVKGRREHRRFALEGETLLGDARSAAFPIDEVYATQAAYDSLGIVRELDQSGTPTFIVNDASAARISDVATPSGVLAIAPVRLMAIDELMRCGERVLVLADVNDPANAGTLLRSADAFGCAGVVFGAAGVDPYHPKVVRGSMGAVFRLAIATAGVREVARAASAAGMHLLGLSAAGVPLEEERWEHPAALVVGNERHGLGAWESVCERTLAIRMNASAESLSAGVAGSIALYQASLTGACQDSLGRPKSQDYRA